MKRKQNTIEIQYRHKRSNITNIINLSFFWLVFVFSFIPNNRLSTLWFNGVPPLLLLHLCTFFLLDALILQQFLSCTTLLVFSLFHCAFFSLLFEEWEEDATIQLYSVFLPPPTVSGILYSFVLAMWVHMTTIRLSVGELHWTLVALVNLSHIWTRPDCYQLGKTWLPPDHGFKRSPIAFAKIRIQIERPYMEPPKNWCSLEEETHTEDVSSLCSWEDNG